MKKAMLVMALALSLPCFVLAENRVGGRVTGGQSTNGLAGTADMLASNAVLNVSITNNTADTIRATNDVISITNGHATAASVVAGTNTATAEMVASNDVQEVSITNLTAEIIRATNGVDSLWVPLFSADLGVADTPISQATLTLLNFSNELFDTDTGYTPSSNGYIATVTGIYYFEFTGNLGGAVTEGTIQGVIKTNDTTALFWRTPALGGSTQYGAGASGYLSLTTGDLVQCFINFGAGSATHVQRERENTQFNGWRQQ